MPLTDAPIGVSLSVNRIADNDFAGRIARLGLYEGSQLMRLNESVAVYPVKVRGLKGDAVISGWLAGRVVIHLDDDRRLPLLECAPGDAGHVEGITGQEIVEDSLKELGIVENDRIVFVRRLPPMTYSFSVAGKGKAQMNESLAAHVLGDTPGGQAQFSSVGAGEVFTVRRILAGEDAEATLASLNVQPGAELTLLGVSASHDLHFSDHCPVACVTKDGLRLYFHEQDAAGIYVSAQRAPSPHVRRLFGS